MKRRDVFWLVALVILGAAVVVLGRLVALPDAPVFFSGDGGLKYLLAQQLVHGPVTPALSLTAPPPAPDLWSAGLYPYGEPFVYEVGGERLLSFPLYFSLVSSPFLALFGWRGLYVLPALGVLLTWCWLIVCCHRARLGAVAMGSAVLALAIASPLTLYGAMFWEHAPAAFLASVSLMVLLPPHRIERPVPAVAAGSLAGLGVFLRPEVLVFVATAIVASLLAFRDARFPRTIRFALGFAVPVVAFWIANRWIYGSIWGLHAAQVTETGAPLAVAAAAAAERCRRLAVDLFSFWPVAGWLVVVTLCAAVSRGSHRREIRACVLALVVAIPLIALVVPNAGGKQWGPRYLLILLPWGAYAVALLVDAMRRHRGAPRLKAAAALALAACLVVGAWINTRQGPTAVARDYRERIAPALRLIHRQPHDVVIVSHQWIPQELAALTGEKVFLWARTTGHFELARERLLEHDIRSALFVTFRPFVPSPELGRFTVLGTSHAYTVRLLEFEEGPAASVADARQSSSNGRPK